MSGRDDKAARKRLKDAYLRAEQASAAARMPIDRRQLQGLLDSVEAFLAVHGCDHTRAATDAWADRAGVDSGRLHPALERFGGYCDCEVVMNVDPDDVFTAVRTTRDPRSSSRD